MIWLIGTGDMAIEYSKVLCALNCNFDVIGRGENSAQSFFEKTHILPTIGGIESRLARTDVIPDYAIIAVGIENLESVAISLLNAGVKNILIEKPGCLKIENIEALSTLTSKMGSNMFVAYNRRWYASVLKAKELIQQDGGVESFMFEFTEWGHVIEALSISDEIKCRWFLANSTHVIDLAFYLGGSPKTIDCHIGGGLNWHPSASKFVGSGISKPGAYFNYHANWNSPGRWGIELMTAERRYIFKPLEMLQIIEKGTVKAETLQIESSLDHDYKPGLYLQTQQFLMGKHDGLCSIQQQSYNFREIYYPMAGYK